MLEITDRGDVRVIRMARPPVNALNPQLVDALIEAVATAGREAQAIVLTGREGLFSAGLDVVELMALDRDGMSRFWCAFFRLLEAVARSPVPVAAAIGGHSPAGGAVMALFCDYRVMAAGDYRIGLNETQVGLVVPPLIQKALVRLVGPHRAERMLVAGAMMGPKDARAVGLVDALEDEPATVVEAAVAWCEQHLALPRHAMLGNRQLARADLCALFDDFSELGVEAFVTGWFSEPTQTTLGQVLARLGKKG